MSEKGPSLGYGRRNRSVAQKQTSWHWPICVEFPHQHARAGLLALQKRGLRWPRNPPFRGTSAASMVVTDCTNTEKFCHSNSLRRNAGKYASVSQYK